MHVARTAEEMGIPGLTFYRDFITEEEEKVRHLCVCYSDIKHGYCDCSIVTTAAALILSL